MTEIGLNRDVIQYIVGKAHEFQMQDDVVFDDEPDIVDEEWSNQVASEYGSDPYYQALRNAIDDLEPDQQVCLVALMWVGRGDFLPTDWAAALQHAVSSWDRNTADYLIGTSLLADYLVEGMELLDSAN